ncbi:MAG: NADH-ubiquinone oxidoreductase chain G, partial [uncultured Solirubrobacteraceae bacterium]
AIDRERCILCYRCVRFSQEISEDYQLILLERGAHSYVGTFDGHPYVGPFSGNIVQLCPVGALTSKSYRFRARPWDSEGAGSICTLCPSQCNIEFTVRDERVVRVGARDNHAVDDGWLCDKGRFGFQHVHADDRITRPWIREGGKLMPSTWEKALRTASAALTKAGPKAAALAGGETTNEEAFLLQRLFREGLGSGHLSSRPGGELPLDVQRALIHPDLAATVEDIEFAHTVVVLDCEPVDDAPILDLRIRKGVRRRGVDLVVATSRPSALDSSASQVLRFAPGSSEAMMVALDAALSGDEGNLSGGAAAAGAHASAVRELAGLLSSEDRGDVVVLYGERLLRAPGAARALLNVASRLGLAGRPGAGLLEIPSSANGRGLREAGFAASHGPGYSALAEPAGRDAGAIATGLAEGDLSTLVLWYADPLRTHADRAAWEAGLGAAQTVIAYDNVMTDSLREHADVILPAEAYAEKEGTITHPDGRLQRLRLAIGRPNVPGGEHDAGVRAGWKVIADLAKAAGQDHRILAGPMASTQLFDAVVFYNGLTLDEIGGKGVRWQTREATGRIDFPGWELARLDPPRPAPQANGSLRLGTFRSLWTSKEVDASPALQFLRPRQSVELSPADAERLGVAPGDTVELGSNGTRVQGAAMLRASVPTGSVFVVEGTASDGANLLTDPLVEVRRVGGVATAVPSGQPVVHQPAVEGLAEAPQSAPLESPPGTPLSGELNE